MNKDKIINHQSALESWMSDISTFVLGVSLMGVGVYLESDAMQWVGAIVFFVASLSEASSSSFMVKLSPKDAIKYIEDNYEVKNDPR